MSRRRAYMAVLAVFLAFIAGVAPWLGPQGVQPYRANVSVPPGVAAPQYLGAPGSYRIHVNADGPLEVYVAPCGSLDSPRGLLASRTLRIDAHVAIGPGDCLVLSNTAGTQAVNASVLAEPDSRTPWPLLWASSIALLASAAYLAYRASLPLEEE